MQKILIATDGSEEANRAVEKGAEIAKKLGAALTLVTIGPFLRTDEHKQFARVEGDAPDAAETFSRSILNEAENLVQKVGISRPKVALAFGDPVQEIIKIAQQEKADAIVVGRRGRGRLSALVLGSVSQELARSAPCAVVVMP